MQYNIIGGISKSGVKRTDYWKNFDPRLNMFINEDSLKSSDAPKCKFRSVVKYEELELFMSMINYLTLYWSGENAKVIISMEIKPTEWLGLLSRLFPVLNFELYSSISDQDVYSNVVIHRRKMTYDDNLGDSYFVGTRLVDNLKHMPKCQLLRLDNLNSNGRAGRAYYSLFSDVLYFVVCGLPTPEEYFTDIVREITNYHNNVTRNGVLTSFKNLWSGDNTSYDILSKLGLHNDWDSTAMIYIIKVYLVKIGRESTEENVSFIIDSICKILHIDKLGDRKNSQFNFKR
jgi:hypothetical protein